MFEHQVLGQGTSGQDSEDDVSDIADMLEQELLQPADKEQVQLFIVLFIA